MKSVRFLLSVTVVLVLGAGYLGSQLFAFNGRAAEWAEKVDTSAIVWLALLLLVGSIALAFLPEREESA